MIVRSHLFAILLASSLGLTITGCPLITLDTGGGTPDVEMPILELESVSLVESPSETQLASYYCHDQLSDYYDRLVCEAGLDLGPAPSMDPNAPNGMRFTFDVVFDVTNPNTFPIPVVELFVQTKIYPGKVEHDAGSLCVTFCDPESEDCDPHADGGCPVDELPEGELGFEVDPNALVDGLIDLVNGDDPSDAWYGNQWIKTIPAGGSTELHIGLTLSTEAMIAILEDAVFQDENWRSLSAGKIPDVVIPYTIGGVLWFDVGKLGRVWVKFGPMEGAWDVTDY